MFLVRVLEKNEKEELTGYVFNFETSSKKVMTESLQYKSILQNLQKKDAGGYEKHKYFFIILPYVSLW